jgi:KDO2-lipid IV(A) lauroyltransferase
VVQTPEGASLDDHGAAIYVGAHVGSWELMPLVLNRNSRPVTVIYTENVTPFIAQRLSRMREETGARYVEKSTALKPCIRALEQGGSIALLVDQRVDPGIDVNFFGRPTTMTRFPARLATRFNRPIIPFEVVRTGPGQLRVIFQDPIVPDGATGKQAEAALTQRMAKAIEASIKRNAESWFCSKLRWKEADKIKAKADKSAASPGTSHPQDALSR